MATAGGADMEGAVSGGVQGRFLVALWPGASGPKKVAPRRGREPAARTHSHEVPDPSLFCSSRHTTKPAGLPHAR